MHRTHDIIALFDRYPEARSLHFDAVVIGGAALNLLGVVSRLTKDCDILFPEIPEEIANASKTFALEVRRNGGDLGDEWLNNGPASLQTQLPPGWRIAFRPHFLVGLSICVPWHEKISYVRSY